MHAFTSAGIRTRERERESRAPAGPRSAGRRGGPASWPAQGPEIRTGFLENEKPVLLEAGQELTITTDYSIKGNKDLISMSYAKLAKVRGAAPPGAVHAEAVGRSPPPHTHTHNGA